MKLQTVPDLEGVDAVGADRRRSPRLPVEGRIQAQSASLGIPFCLSDLSRTGFAVKSAVAFPTGVSHQFRFVTTAGLEIVIEARSVHVSPVEGDDGPYKTGFEFLIADDPAGARAVEQLLRHLYTTPAIGPVN